MPKENYIHSKKKIPKLKITVLIDRIVIIISQLVVASVKDVVANPTRWLPVSNTE